MTNDPNLVSVDTPAPRPVHGWWRRNAIALVAVIVLATATVTITSARQWNTYYGYGPAQPVDAAPGDTAALGGATYRLIDVQTLVRGDYEAREGEELPSDVIGVLVSIEVTRDGQGSGPLPGCSVDLRETGGPSGVRTWEGGLLDQITLPATEGTMSYCDSEATSAYTLQVPFAVPDDVTGDLTVMIEVQDQLPRFVQLQLPPL